MVPNEARPMRHGAHPRLSAILCGLILIGGPGRSTAAAIPLKAFKSRCYVIHTNLNRRQAIDFGTHMDRVFEQYENQFKGFHPRQARPMPLYLLRRQEDYVRFLSQLDINADPFLPIPAHRSHHQTV